MGGTIRRYSTVKHCLLRQTQMQILFMLTAVKTYTVKQKSACSIYTNYIPCLFAQIGGIQSLLQASQDEELSSEVKVPWTGQLSTLPHFGLICCDQ
jgi:hypothetical protein